jgi:hypothetical protein
VADFIKCLCSNCGAKYRLPLEFQGRRARCKKCGEKFEVPKVKKTLEDSVLDWLNEGEEQEVESEETAAQPRVISMPKEAAAPAEEGAAGNRRRGVIRIKTDTDEEKE